jgi:FemAB-related protein (PEP-CTERM system-associated)
MDIKIFENKDESRWDRFVKENDASTFFHLIGWKSVVEKTYGHRPLYLLAEEKGEVAGILPLFLVESLIFGKRLVSVPYSPYGGCCAQGRDVTDAILGRAVDLSKEYNAKYLELRNMQSIPGMPNNDKLVTMVLDLSQGEETVWSNLRKNMKRCVQKASKEDFNVTLGSGDIEGFYPLYRKRMHELGTPAYSYSFFRNIMADFPDTEVATVDYRGEVLASLVLVFFRKTVIYGWGASSKNRPETHPVHWLLWKVIQNNIQRGYKTFDLGRSAPETGIYDFKKGWGAEPQTLYYQFHMNKKQEIPYIHPSNPRYNVAIKAWRTLPLPIVNLLGPFVSKELI